MPKENKTVELKDEELEKVSGGFQPGEGPNQPSPESSVKGLYCPDCGSFMTSEHPIFLNGGGEVFCPTCNKDVKPISK